MQIQIILQLRSTSFLILKLLHDSLIINVTNYIFFKILVQYNFSMLYQFGQLEFHITHLIDDIAIDFLFY